MRMALFIVTLNQKISYFVLLIPLVSASLILAWLDNLLQLILL